MIIGRHASLAALAGALALALPALGCNAQSSNALAGPDAAFDAKVKTYLLSHPEVIEEAMEKLQARQDAQKEADAKAAIASRRNLLENDPRDGVAGNPHGKVTVVEFFDYRCPYCKAAEPALQQLLDGHSEVRLVLKEFPILDVEDQTHISEDAARAALGAIPQGKYVQLHRALLAERRLDEAAIARMVAASGADAARDKAAGGSAAISTQIADTHALARAIGVDGTPAFIVGDKLIAEAQMTELEAAITAAK